MRIWGLGSVRCLKKDQAAKSKSGSKEGNYTWRFMGSYKWGYK